MRDEEDGHATLLQFLDAPHAPVLEDCVTNSEGLINDQYLRGGTNRHRECEANVHPARICFDWLMDERTYLSKAFDFGQQRFCFTARKPHQGRIHEDVFNPGELTIESSSKFKQTGDPAFMPDSAMSGLERPDH